MKRHYKRSLIILLILAVALSLLAIITLFNLMVTNGTDDWLVIIGKFLIIVFVIDMVCGLIVLIKVLRELKK